MDLGFELGGGSVASVLRCVQLFGGAIFLAVLAILASATTQQGSALAAGGMLTSGSGSLPAVAATNPVQKPAVSTATAAPKPPPPAPAAVTKPAAPAAAPAAVTKPAAPVAVTKPA